MLYYNMIYVNICEHLKNYNFLVRSDFVLQFGPRLSSAICGDAIRPAARKNRMKGLKTLQFGNFDFLFENGVAVCIERRLVYSLPNELSELSALVRVVSYSWIYSG